MDSKDEKPLTCEIDSLYLCFIRSAIKGWLGQAGQKQRLVRKEEAESKSAPKNRDRKAPGTEGESRSSNAERQRKRRPAAAELGKADAKVERPSRADSDPEKKGPKGTGLKGQSK